MEEQQSVETIRAYIGERYPMYVANPGFEQWLLEKAGTDGGKIGEYLALLDDYGYITGDGTLASDYQKMPDPGSVTGDILHRLEALRPETRVLLRQAAVQGGHFTLEGLAATDGMPGNGRALLDEAIAAGVVAPDDHGAGLPWPAHRYRFIPLQTARVLYEELSDEERASYHAALVEFLSAEAEREVEPGAQDMLAQMISEHNKRFARPDSSPSKD